MKKLMLVIVVIALLAITVCASAHCGHPHKNWPKSLTTSISQRS